MLEAPARIFIVACRILTVVNTRHTLYLINRRVNGCMAPCCPNGKVSGARRRLLPFAGYDILQPCAIRKNHGLRNCARGFARSAGMRGGFARIADRFFFFANCPQAIHASRSIRGFQSCNARGTLPFPWPSRRRNTPERAVLFLFAEYGAIVITIRGNPSAGSAHAASLSHPAAAFLRRISPARRAGRNAENHEHASGRFRGN